MKPQRLCFFAQALGAMLALPFVKASPHDGLNAKRADLRVHDLATHSCTDFGVGAPNGFKLLGQVCVDITPSSLTVTYPTLPIGDSYTAAHLYVGLNQPTNRNPGGFPYNSYCAVSGRNAQCVVPLSALPTTGCGTHLFVAAQADVVGTDAGTGWGQGTPFDCPNPNSNCAKWFEIITSCQCTVVTTYAPVYCTSTVTSLTTLTSTPPSVTSVTTCDIPTVTTTTVTGPPPTCAACASPYFCGCT